MFSYMHTVCNVQISVNTYQTLFLCGKHSTPFVLAFLKYIIVTLLCRKGKHLFELLTIKLCMP